MRSTELNIGDCPYCNDEVFVFKTKSRSRVAKCINEDCPVGFAFGIPKKGMIELTALYCPKPVPPRKAVGSKDIIQPQVEAKIQLLAIVPAQYIKSGTFRTQTKKTYFWANRPCFTCATRSKCAALLEARDEFLDEPSEVNRRPVGLA